MNYFIWLLLISLIVAIFEWIWPAREQKKLRKWLWSDVVHIVFNGHFLGVFLYGISTYHLLPHLNHFLSRIGLETLLYFGAAESWPLIVQTFVALLVIDLGQWCIHRTLHRIEFLWKIHQIHHSVKDGEMDWIVAFRFSWLEPVIYKTMMFVPLMWFGFAPETIFFHAIVGTLIGHLNHANLSWDYGPLRYVLNSPRMHLHHHDYHAPHHGHNFGIIFSCWDWLFGTAYLPNEPPKKIGFPNVQSVPNDFFAQQAWPLPLWFASLQNKNLIMSLLGLVILGGVFGASLP